MIVLDTNNTSQTIGVLPRYYADLTTDITFQTFNEDTREEVFFAFDAPPFQLIDGFLVFSLITLGKPNNTTYRLKIVENVLNKVIFRGKIFTTDQSIQNYSIDG